VLQPNSPSCGNQPAYISLTARRPDTHVASYRPAPARLVLVPAAAQHAAVLAAVKENSALDRGCAPRHRTAYRGTGNKWSDRPRRSCWAQPRAPL